MLAQDDAVLVRLLGSARDFRVRSQAALSLGHTRNAAHVALLERALDDRHPLVRAAAATALGELGASRALPALRIAARDKATAVAAQARSSIAYIERMAASSARSAAVSPGRATAQAASTAKLDQVRYVLVVGAMHDESGFPGAEVARVLDASLWRELSTLRSVAVLRGAAEPAIAEAVRRGLPVLRLEGNVSELAAEVSGEQLSVHCELSLLVMDDAGRNLRTVLKGAATGIEPLIGTRAPELAHKRRVARTAIDGAVRSALRNASGAIENAAARAEVHGQGAQTAALH